MKTKKKAVIGIIILSVVVITIISIGVYMHNKKQNENADTGIIKVEAIDQTGQPVYEVAYDFMSDEKVYGNIATGYDGVIMLYNVPLGNYSFRETFVPKNYESDYQETSFDVEKQSTTTVTMNYIRKVPRLVITVLNEEKEPIEGATINLYGSENGEDYLIEECVSNSKGKIYHNFEEPGTYYFQQTETTDEYKIDDNLYRIEMDNEDNFTFYTTVVNENKEN